MGGVVARLASAVDATKIDSIVTLSSPQLLLPVTFERDMDTIQETITRAAAMPHSPPLLSICGGVSDTQVVSDACALTSEHLGNNSGFAVFTTAMPGVWTTVEHQAIVWCHQVRWRIARALLEMTRGERIQVAKTWLVGDGRSEEEHLPEGNTYEFSASVTSLNMSLTIRPAADSPADQPHAEVQWCGVIDCRPLRYTYTALPEPRDQRAPFPLPGEGTQPGELAYSLSLQVPANHGRIVVRAAHAVDIRAGEYEAHVVHGSSWGE
jgi:glycosylphosphatidylinositol deacylase